MTVLKRVLRDRPLPTCRPSSTYFPVQNEYFRPLVWYHIWKAGCATPGARDAYMLMETSSRAAAQDLHDRYKQKSPGSPEGAVV